MSDPRNTAHDKKVKHNKGHHPDTGAGVSPAKAAVAEVDPGQTVESVPATTAQANGTHSPQELEKSVAVLSKLKEMEFHSRANIETLAGLTLTIEDELKQKEFAEPIGALYSAQDVFHTKIAELIKSYDAKCESLRPV